MQGNDAGYTIEALIGICFKALTYEHPEAPDPERLSTAAADAQARIIEDNEEWEIADEEGGDGGVAVKPLPAAEMAQNRAFQQGLNRAAKAEDRANRNYGRNDTRNKQRDNRQSGKRANGYDANYPTLKPSIERKGEIKYHAANEKKMREKAAQESDDDGWGYIGEDDGKAAGLDNSSNGQTNTSDPNGNAAPHSQNNEDPNYIPPHKRGLENRAPNELSETKKSKDGSCEDDVLFLKEKERKKASPAPAPPQRLMARMKLLDAYDDDDRQGGVSLA